MPAPRPLARLALAFVAFALTACAGATEQLVEIAPGDADAGTSSGASSSGDSSSSSGSSSGSAGSSSGSSSGSTPAGPTPSAGDDAGDPSNGSGPDPGSAPSQCPNGGTEQTAGSGDSPFDPTHFDTVACGSLSTGQSYWWTFTLPGSTSRFGMAFTGGMQISLTLDGKTVNVVPGATLPFQTNDPYTVQVTPLGSEAQSYVLVVTEK